MRSYTKLEIGAAVVGTVFIIFGIVMIVHPSTITLIPDNRGSYNYVYGPNDPVHISKSGSQILGALSVIMGAGISWLALRRERK